MARENLNKATEQLAGKFERTVDGLGIRPFQRLRLVAEVCRQRRAGKTDEQIARDLRARGFLGIDWSKIDWEKIISVVAMIVKLFAVI